MRSSTGKWFVQALLHKVVLGVAWCKLFSIKKYREVMCGSLVV